MLTNETAENCCFELGVSTCRPRLEMPDGVPVGIYANPILAYDGEAYATLHGRFGWSAVAVRPHAISPREDWVVEAWDAPSGGSGAPPFGCLSGLLGASTDDGTGSRVDFLARYDVPVPPLREWVETQHVYPAAHASPGGGGIAEFEMWNNTLPLGTLINLFPTTPFDLIEVWNVELVAGQSYAVHFAPVGFEGELFIMRSTRTDFTGCPDDCPPEYQPLGGAGQLLRTSGPTVFMAPETGVYGLIVVNQNAAAGSFSLAIDATLVGVDPGEGTPLVTRFRAAAPNPLGRAGTQFAFDLAQESSVGFEVVNIAGRVVARVPERTYPAGAGQAAWQGRGDDGAPVAPGVYFVRMRVGGAIVDGGGKLIVL